MADHIYATITIGGDVPYEKIKGLAEAIATEGIFEIGTGRRMTNSDDVEKYLLACAQVNKNPTFYDDQAPWGQFEDLEEWLKENDIDFDRDTEPSYEYDGETQAYRHETEEVYVYLHNASDHPVVKENVLVNWVKWLQENQIKKVINEIIKFIDPYPKLKPFKIVLVQEVSSEELSEDIFR